uniref:Uncharacterized protein n=1 Tax=Sphaerodactylus townsendi TaxID=933632 RepID=A0ACB8F189_9SAUR
MFTHTHLNFYERHWSQNGRRTTPIFPLGPPLHKRTSHLRYPKTLPQGGKPQAGVVWDTAPPGPPVRLPLDRFSPPSSLILFGMWLKQKKQKNRSKKAPPPPS